MVIADIDLGAAQKTADEITGSGGTARAYALDVADSDAFARFAATVADSGFTLILLGIFGAVYLGRPDRHPSASAREANVGVDELPPGLDDDTLKPLTPPPPHDPHAQGGSA